MAYRAPENGEIPHRIVAVLAALRMRQPHIHAITSPVAQTLTANGLLALGAIPSLTINAGETGDFIRAADAVLLNLGMLDPARSEVLPLAAGCATRLGKPFVVDPVFAERSAPRRALAEALFAGGPGIVKLNPREAEAFAGRLPASAVQVVTGPVDEIRHGARKARLANGHPLLAQVTATGCLNGAILAACLAVEDDPFVAAIAGVSFLNIAAEIAASGAEGPGSFAVRLIDALAALDADALHLHLKLESFRDGTP